MNKKPKYKIDKWSYRSFESNQDTPNNDFAVRISTTMRKSQAWEELNLGERALYMEFKARFTIYDDGTDNKNLIEFTRGGPNGYEKLLNQRTFYKYVNHLIELGFLKCVESGWTTKTKNIYGFSDKWKVYKKGETLEIPNSEKLATRKLDETHKENIKNNLKNINANKKKKDV